MLDATHIKAHLRGESQRWQQRHEPYKRRLNIKLHLALDTHKDTGKIRVKRRRRGRLLVCRNTDCNIAAGKLLFVFGKAYDTDVSRSLAAALEINTVISPKTSFKGATTF